MNVQPAYFESIRLKTARRWEQLEQDPELAAPWHQLFKQVQSPRHILSELLQNADDAGATEATVRIEGDVFIFEHNGEDFTEEHFASLCRFGYSNKRALHTIGFRGIGFKSTFSLGNCVELFTPTLAVSFDRKHFTEPRWHPCRPDIHGKTCIRVAISDLHRQKELEKNLEEWLKSPLSLLFFKNIRQLQIGEHPLHWTRLKSGPIADSEWMVLNEQEEDAFLLLRSQAIMFPQEALSEIRQERMLGSDDDMDFPPSTIEIVLGGKGRLFVILPTGVETKLPFACNAPFIQDPARLKIKDPEISPTNRWLLERAGRLAASAMLSWLGQTDLTVGERVGSYSLFPDVDRKDSSLEGGCGTIAEMAFAETISAQPVLLTDDGKLALEKESVIIPQEIFGIWPAEQAAALLDGKGRPPLCRHIAPTDQKKLLHWELVEQIGKHALLGTLQRQPLPKPATWRHLLNLWAYIAPEIANVWPIVSTNDLRIVPVQGKDVLYAATEVVRLAEKKLLQSDEDWAFLSAYLLVLNQNWPRFLAEQRISAVEQKNEAVQKTINAAYAVLAKIGLNDTSDVNTIIDQVADTFFFQESVGIEKCVQFAQIAAKLGATAGDSLYFVTRDLKVRHTTDTILFDEDNTLEYLLPEYVRKTQLLHSNYTAGFSSCSKEEWLRWIDSGRAGLLTFSPLVQRRERIRSYARAQQEAKKRGLKGSTSYPYVTNQFIIEDWNFEEIYWTHWKALAANDEQVWAKVVERILRQRFDYWNQAKSARLLQVATTNKEQSITNEALLPSWALRLRDVPCLPDTRSFYWKPGDLLRRTPETESLMDVEPFVHGHLDHEANRPLLDLLGVRSTPTGPDRLLDRLRALAGVEKPPIHEIEKWYHRLDQMVDTCSTSDFQKIKQAFRSEKLVLTQDGSWVTAAAIFLAADEDDIPGVAVIRLSLRDLTLWHKIDVAPRATAELAIQWLKGLPSGGGLLAPDDARRVRALLARYPEQVWNECLHWINLAGEWTPVATMRYALTMQSLIPWQHLHQWVKQSTADLRTLSRDMTNNTPFSALPPLAQCLEERFSQKPSIGGRFEKAEWLAAIGAELCWIELNSEEDMQRIRAVAERLVRTEWHTTELLEIIPYLEGTPAGTARQADILWFGHTLYVAQMPKAKLAKRVPDEIGKAFSRDDIKAALDYSFERSPEDVREYLEENFKLGTPAIFPETINETADTEVAEAPILPSLEAHMHASDELHDDTTTDMQSDTAASAQPNDDEPASVPNADQPAARPRPAPRPSKPNLIERFAKAQGFRIFNGDRFVRADGSWIARTNGMAFPWECRTKSGDLVRYYWLKEHCLHHEPLQLETAIWVLLERYPENYALILVNTEDEPVEMTGADLCTLRKQGKITLNPAAYRLVYDTEDPQ